MANNRAKPTVGVETEVLTSSARRCALCFGLDHDLDEKPGQIAHVDGDRSNSSLDNLAWLCLPHHDRYDGRTSQSKGITRHELKEYRSQLYTTIKLLRSELNSTFVSSEVLLDVLPLSEAQAEPRSAAEVQEYIIQRCKEVHINRASPPDRTTTLNQENRKRTFNSFHPDYPFGELVGKRVDWEVYVLDVYRVSAMDGHFIVVHSHLVSGGTPIDWYFGAHLEGHLAEIAQGDTMAAKGVFALGGYLANCELAGSSIPNASS